MTPGSSESVSRGSERILLMGRRTSKASVAAHGVLIALLSGGLILTPMLSMATDTHRHLAECGFQWGWFYIESPFITALEMTQLFWNECAE